MTVEELIENLKKFDKNEIVYRYVGEEARLEVQSIGQTFGEENKVILF